MIAEKEFLELKRIEEEKRIAEEKRITELRLKEIQEQLEKDEDIAKKKLKKTKPGKESDGRVSKTCSWDNEQLVNIFQSIKIPCLTTVTIPRQSLPSGLMYIKTLKID